MNSDITASPPVRRHSLWWWLGISAAATVVIAGFAVWNVITLTREARALRSEVFAALDIPASTQVQLSAGPVILTAVRAGLACIDQVPPEARRALAAVRTASVGVYQLHGEVSARQRATMLASADAAMTRRGWMRVVGVNDNQDLVMIYVPASERTGHVQRVCLAVCDGEHVVIVAGAVDAEPLVELIRDRGALARL